MFLETICIKNGIVQRAEAHHRRIRQTAAHFGFRPPVFPELEKLIPLELQHGFVKCRIVYREKISEITFAKYEPKQIRSLKLIEAPRLDYAYKYADRSVLTQLLAQKGECDEILITQNGCITDTSYSNVVFCHGNSYFTPDTYLLNGTKRQTLLSEGKIASTRITVSDIARFDSVRLINAMLDIEDGIAIQTENIVL